MRRKVVLHRRFGSTYRSILKRQAVLLRQFDPRKWDGYLVPKRLFQSTLRCVITKKMDEFISTAAET
jgi:hypothetical protein